jgi:hypothetical protein
MSIIKFTGNYNRNRGGPPDIQKIRSIIPLLGADNADMALTAVDAIIRCLESTGHDLNDLADLLAPRRTHRAIARKILQQHADDLLEHELKFAQVMACRPRCTERQAEWLESIYCRFF